MDGKGPQLKSDAITIALNWTGLMVIVLESMLLGLCSSTEKGGEPPYAATIAFNIWLGGSSKRSTGAAGLGAPVRT